MKTLFTIIFALWAGVVCASEYMPVTTAEEYIKGAMNEDDTYKITFLTTSADCGNTGYTGYGDVSAYEVGGITAGGHTIADASYPIDTSVSGYVAGLEDFGSNYESSNQYTLTSQTWTAVADCVVIYNDSHTNDQILYMADLNTGIQPNNADVIVNFPPSGAANAILRFTVPSP